MEKKRLVGVTICGIAMLCYGIWILLGRLILPIMLSLFRDIFPKDYGIFLIFLVPGNMPLPISLFVGLIYLIAGIGILTFKQWGRIVAVFFSTFVGLLFALTIITYISVTVTRNEGALGAGIMASIIGPLWPSLFFLLFLTRPTVKEQFK